MLPQLGHERAHEVAGDLVDAVVVVAEHGELAFGLVVGDQAGLVTDHLHLRVLDRRQAVGDDRQSRHAERHGPQRRVVVQRHLDPLVGVFVVHVVNDVHGVHVHARQPVHHLVEALDHLVEVEVVALDRLGGGADLLAARLVAAAVDGVEQTLGQVGARAEELHLLAHQHRRHATGDRAVVAPRPPHDFVALELERAGVDGHLRREVPEAVRHPRGVPDREIRLRCRAQVVERLQHAEAALRHERSAIVSHAADGLGHPRRIAGEQLVVFRRPQEPDDAELDDEVVDDFLRLLLRQPARLEIALEVDVEEGRAAAERHGRPVLLLHRGEVAEVQPLHGFARGPRRARNIAPVGRGHRLQFLQRPDLLGQLLTVADDFLGGRLRIERQLFLLLPRDQPVDAVERHAPVVADDAAAAVGVGQAREDVRAPARADVGGVGVEHALVVRLPVLGERLHHVRIRRVAVRFQRAEHHAQPAVRHDRALERRIGLEPHDDFAIAVDVARPMCGDRTRDLRDVEHALLAFFDEQGGQRFPDVFRPRGRGRKKRRVALVGRVVELDEGADVDFLLPERSAEPFPRRIDGGVRGWLRCGRAHVRLQGRRDSRAAAGNAEQRARVAGDHQLFVGRNDPHRYAAA